jgi:hypothetical protein
MPRTPTCTSGKGFGYCEDNAYVAFATKGSTPDEVNALISKERLNNSVRFREAQRQSMMMRQKVTEPEALAYVEGLLNGGDSKRE